MNYSSITYLKKELSKVQILFKEKEFNLVIQRCKALLKKNPNQAIIYNYIGLSYIQLNEIENALKTFLSADQKLLSEPSILCNIGLAYKNLDDVSNARNYFNKAISINPKHLPSHINLGHLENNLNHSEKAANHYLKAYNLNNNSEEVLTYNILYLSAQGKFIEAKKIILELNNKFPENTKSFQLYSKIHNYTLEDPHQKIMLSKINIPSLNDVDLSNLHFALAKSFYDQKNNEKFVHHTLKANELKFKTFKDYNFKLEEEQFEQIKKHYENFHFQNHKDNKGENLIFILGLPRSGTTLLHQIISSHSKTFGAEESHVMSDFFIKRFKNENSLTNFFSNELVDKDICSKLSDEILSKYKMYDQNKIIVDKMPFNYKWIGFIKILFPHAKIIHSNRNPVDSAFSIYRNVFDSPGIGWAYNQDYLTKYVNLYSNLMSFWKQKLGNFIYESHYEKLVTQQVNETKNILEFCNLKFEDSCVNYTHNNIPSRTISVYEVRNKIYKSSLNLSDKYLNYFPFLNQIKKKAP
jgi:tetratricopeptide (TPR) repeat protein